MPDDATIHDIAHFCIEPIRSGSNKESDSRLSLNSFELRMELYFVLFLGTHLDGNCGHHNENFIQSVCRQLGWPATELSLLNSRIDHLPAYTPGIVTVSLHFVFSGAPGTAKTTVARIMAKI